MGFSRSCPRGLINMNKICLQCKKEFKIQLYRKDTAIFCSHSCVAKFHNKKEKHPMWKGGLPKCLDCNIELSNYENKRCVFHARVIGERNGMWVKDRTKLVKNEKKHLDGQYREWMFTVKKRDDWRCKINNKQCKGRLEAHHILNWKQYPELRYEVNNGITLCHAHHPRGRENEAKLSPYLQSLVASVE